MGLGVSISGVKEVAKVERIRIGADPEPGFEILGLGLGVSGLGPRASGFWLRLSDLAFLVWGVGCQTSSVLFNVSELGFRGSNFGLYSTATGVLFPQTKIAVGIHSNGQVLYTNC